MLTTPAGDLHSHYEWVGAPVHISADKIYYMALRPRDDPRVVSQLDTVELLSGDGRLPFVAQVEAFWEEHGLWKVRELDRALRVHI
jgi:hypothetical protein